MLLLGLALNRHSCACAYSLFLVCLLLGSCAREIEIESDSLFEFNSPRANWIYYADTPVLLSSNLMATDLLWTSSLSGFIGSGNGIRVLLPPGTHVITAVAADISGSVTISVENRLIEPLQEIRHSFSPGNRTVYFPPGNYSSMIYSLGGSAEQVSVVIDEKHLLKTENLNIRSNTRLPLSLYRIDDLSKKRLVSPKQRRSITNRALEPGSRRNFFVMNTSNPLAKPHELECVLLDVHDLFALWIPFEASIETQDYLRLYESLSSLIIPRVQTLWGSCTDIDGDGRIAILLTPTINEEKKAIGFFNPSDLFSRCEDPADPAYNPWSNEMDLLYLAFPCSDGGESYGIDSLCATAAHELTHAVTFSRKTLERIKAGEVNAQQEELFLDEGWSHLSESLCGFGLSGGNLQFVERFLQEPGCYSFCGPDWLGRADSVGMRGAITLFLYWLFEESGGMEWVSTDPRLIKDCGGISFLQRMLSIPENGWESIGLAFGEPVESLFSRFVSEIHRKTATGGVFPCLYDPVTEEPITVSVNMGTFMYSDIETCIGSPAAEFFVKGSTILPWSFRRGFGFFGSDLIKCELQSSLITGQVFFSALFDGKC